MIETRVSQQKEWPSLRRHLGRRWWMALLAVVAVATVWRSATPASNAYYTGPVTDHFDGHRFFDPDTRAGAPDARRKGALDYLQLAWSGRRGRSPWPASVPVKPSVPPRRVEGEAMLVTWIGHASTLIQTQGLNILMDPVWSEWDSPVKFFGPRRVREPGVRLADLPPIDLVLISHNHYDHLDLATLRFLSERDHPTVVVGLGNDRLLADEGIAAVARDWGGRVSIRPGIDVVLTRAHHWSSRWLDDIDRTLWTGFRVTLPGGDLYYSGDTGPGDMHWATEARGTAAVRFAILPIGPYKIGTPPTGNHIDPAQAVTAFQQLGAAYALGVHWGTFELGPEPIDGPPKLLAQSLAGNGIDAGRFRATEAGESWNVPLLPDR